MNGLGTHWSEMVRPLPVIFIATITSPQPSEVTLFNFFTPSRNKSSQVDDLSGVWCHATELDSNPTPVLVVNGVRYVYFDYSRQHGYERSRSGPVFGQEGVYFFPNRSSYYSPVFYVRQGSLHLLVHSRDSFANFQRTGRVPITTLVRSGAKFDKTQTPPTVSFQDLGVLFDNPFA